MAVPNLGVEQRQEEAHREDPQAAELPSLEEAAAAVVRVAVPIRPLAVVRLPARRAWALRKKHKTYWWGGFGNRTAGTRSSFLRLGRLSAVEPTERERKHTRFVVSRVRVRFDYIPENRTAAPAERP